MVFFMVHLTACSIFSKPSVPMTGSQAADANVQLGLAYLQTGDVQRAHQKLLLAEQQAPDSLQTQGAMGYFLENTGNSSSADAYYRRAIALNPRSGAAQNNYAAFLCRRGNYREADQHFLLALQDPSYLNGAQVYENAGLCAMQIPNNTKAKAYFSQAVMQDPNRSLAWLELSQISYQEKDYQQAQSYLDHYLQLTKEPSANALRLAANLASVLGNQSAAANYTLMLSTRFPDSDAYKTLMRSSTLKLKQKNKPLYY